MSADQADSSQSLPIEVGRANWLRLVRNKKQRERYGPAHLRRRRDFARRIERREMILCFRCERRSVATRTGTSITTTGTRQRAIHRIVL